HDQPPRPRPPGGLDDQRSGQVAAPGGDGHPSGAEPEIAGGPVQDRREHARAVRPGEAHPLDPAARCDQAVGFAVGEERVFGDRGKRASDVDLTRLGGELRRMLSVSVDGGPNRLSQVGFSCLTCRVSAYPRRQSICARSPACDRKPPTRMAAMSTDAYTITLRPGHPDLMDLDWARSITEWTDPRLVDLPRGIS